MSVTENKHFSYIHSSIPRVREEIGSLEKRINETFSNVRQYDANILKFDEDLETLRSAIVENYSNVMPKKITYRVQQSGTACIAHKCHQWFTKASLQ